ncbi:UDP-4-amino-4,6-dideoxy-N-acetyl-beta-L-altrosamine transaminase [Pelagibacterales bacterium SAG-MED32]|nr:UDP-4-amino-4,6-dideoxy-N-acetyl-beta-L-altrosamine transaminase [Pelagibacterales bacterium SAG-MED32]
MIPYGRQEITSSDINEVKKVLTSNFITQGNTVPKFEKLVAKKVKAKFAIAVNSATSALHLSCMALGVTKNDIVWTSAISFVASANCAIYCGAKIDFVDISLKNFNICPKKLEEKLKIAKKKSILPSVLVAVHMCGQPCDMKRIYNLSKKYNFKIIEDASHAIGSKYKNTLTGSCKYSSITVFSFHPVKIITTGEGGIATTNSKRLMEKMQILRTHGITKNQKSISSKKGGWYYEQIDLGYNYRMTDISASLGISQLRRLDSYIKRRNDLAKRYDLKLRELPLILPEVSDKIKSSFHLYVVLLDTNQLKINRLKLFNKLRSVDIGVQIHYIPIYKHPFYKKLLKKDFKLDNSEDYYERCISIPIYPSMKMWQQDKVINALRKFLV